MDFLRHLMRLFLVTLSPRCSYNTALHMNSSLCSYWYLIFAYHIYVFTQYISTSYKDQQVNVHAILLPFSVYFLDPFSLHILQQCWYAIYFIQAILHRTNNAKKKIAHTDLLQFSLENTLIIKPSQMARKYAFSNKSQHSRDVQCLHHKGKVWQLGHISYIWCPRGSKVALPRVACL